VTRNKERSQTLNAFVSIRPGYRPWVTPSLQKAIWLASTFLPRGNKIDVSLGNTRCLQSFAPRKRLSRSGDSRLGPPHRHRAGHAARSRRRRAQTPESGPQPAHPPVCCVCQLRNGLITSKRKFSSACATGLSLHRNSNNSQVRKRGPSRPPSPPSQVHMSGAWSGAWTPKRAPKRAPSTASSELDDEVTLVKQVLPKQLLFTRALFLRGVVYWVCVARFQQQEGYRGGCCEKLQEPSPVSDRANASQLQDGPATGQGQAHQP